MAVKFNTFSPRAIKWQDELIEYVLGCDYSKGVYQTLLSGGLGSAKTTPISWLALYFAASYPNLRIALCRKTLPDIKSSLYLEVCDQLIESGLDQYVTKWSDPTATIVFENGSEIFPVYWGDGNHDRVKTKINIALFDEMSENDFSDKHAILMIAGRLGRERNKPSFLLGGTNPESPEHWLYSYFFDRNDPFKKVFLSSTYDNVYLPKSFTEERERDYSPSEIRRYLKGEWIHIGANVVYDSYAPERNHKTFSYVFDRSLPVDLTFDFNIAQGKPMSCAVAQYNAKDDTFHFGGEAVVEGASTEAILEELAAKGYLDVNAPHIRIFGDCNGNARSTKSLASDFDIILKFLRNYVRSDGQRLRVEYKVSSINPPIRTRHNTVKGYCLNGHGDVRLYTYKDAPTCHKAMLYTKLKKGAELVEVEDPWQHIGTAMGYYICFITNERKTGPMTYARRNA